MPNNPSRLRSLILIAACLAIFIAGVVYAMRAGFYKEHKFVRASVSILDREDLDRQPLEVASQAGVEQLASFFPGVGRGRSNGMQAGWISQATITFWDEHGNEHDVHVHFRNSWWSEGHGDWPLDVERLSALIESLEQEGSEKRE